MKLNMSQKTKKQNKLHTMIGAISWLVLATTLAGFGGLCMVSIFEWPVSGRFGVVQSGSMEPSIPIGSLLWLSARASYTQDDVIAFVHPNAIANTSDKSNTHQSKIIALHRIIDVTQTEYVTKGDANSSSDPWKVAHTNVIGEVTFQILYVGYLITWLQTPNGIVLSLVVPIIVFGSHILRTYIHNKKNRPITRILLNQ